MIFFWINIYIKIQLSDWNMGPCTTAPGDSEVSRGKVTTNEEKLHVGPEKLVLNKRGSGKEINGSFR